MAVPGAMLQRDAPLPARPVRGRTRVRRQRPRPARARHRKGTVAQQPLAPVLIAHAHRVADQQTAHARAVDEQVSIHPAAIGEHDMVEEAVTATPVGGDDPSFDPLDARRLCPAAQEAREQRGIEMIGVIDVGDRRLRIARVGHREAIHPRRQRVERIMVEVLRSSARALLQPELVAVQPVQVLPDLAEAMDIAVAGRAPVAEFDAELERRLRRADHFELVDAGKAVEGADRRDGRFADADRANLFRFDQADRVGAERQARQQRRGHPARGATADDGDRLERGIGMGVGHRRLAQHSTSQ